MVFGTAQNRLFPLYVAAASLAGFALALVTSRLDLNHIAAAVPAPPERKALAAYLIAVAAALTLAWLPGMIMTAVTGTIAETVGPYTSATTEALDLGLVVPIAVIAAVQLLTQRPMGRVLALIMLVGNVCIGVVLMAQGVAQLVSGVPLTAGEIVTKIFTFAALTLIASGLLARMAQVGAKNPT
jgi:surface polysaccharide O-acyltransferase-like enzyme